MDLSKLFEKELKQSTQYEAPKDFIIVGAGGTGGYLIPNLARQVSLQNKIRVEEGLSPHTITLIDGDIVETKNLTRQQFVNADIGRNKAEVMARRYGGHFEVPITYIPEFIKDAEMFYEIMRGNHRDNRIPVVIDCVDNNKTRMLMYNAIIRFRGKFGGAHSYFLSSGNEEHTGQVIFSTIGGHRLDEVLNHVESTNSDFSGVFMTPSIVDLFPSTANGEDKLPTEESCAEQSVSAPQNIHTNMTAANLLFGFVNQILQRGGEINHFAIFFDTKNSGFRTFYNKKSDFEAALNMTKDNPAKNYFLGSSRRPDYEKLFGPAPTPEKKPRRSAERVSEAMTERLPF